MKEDKGIENGGIEIGDLPDLEKQEVKGGDQTVLTVVVVPNAPDPVENTPKAVVEEQELTDDLVDSPKKGNLSRSGSGHEQCRVCQQEKEEELIVLGCQCRGDLAKAHQSCIVTWFATKGSNICEICQNVAANVPPPELQPTTSYWVWRVDPAFRGSSAVQEQRSCVSPLWVAFSILVGGLCLDVLISITLGVSALPVNIIVGVIIVLGLGTAIRLSLELCHEWSARRLLQRVETNVNHGYHPAF